MVEILTYSAKIFLIAFFMVRSLILEDSHIKRIAFVNGLFRVVPMLKLPDDRERISVI